jgi:hypothetical protein
MKRNLYTALACLTSLLGHAQFCDVTISHEINGNQVQYFATSEDEPTQYSWFFNGGTPSTSSEQNPIITYNTPGEYICAVSISGGPNDCSAAFSNDQDTVLIGQTAILELLEGGLILEMTGDHRIVLHNDRAQWVNLGLHDVYGKWVASLFSGQLPSGTSSFATDGFHLSDGIYVVRIDGRAGSMTRRIHLRRL